MRDARTADVAIGTSRGWPMLGMRKVMVLGLVAVLSLASAQELRAWLDRTRGRPGDGPKMVAAQEDGRIALLPAGGVRIRRSPATQQAARIPSPSLALTYAHFDFNGLYRLSSTRAGGATVDPYAES